MALRFARPVANGALCQGRRVSAARPTICRAQQAQRVRSSVQKGQPDDDQEFDSQALLKYLGAVPLQVGIMSGALWGVQQGAQLLMTTDALPAGVSGDDAARLLVTLFFLVISIRSRIFSPLPASRPSLNSEKADKAAGLRPWWCPPGIAFPIGWTTVGLLRTISSVSVWEASGRDAMTLPLIMMLVQLSCGDCWNHIRNVEQRIGVATTGMIVNVATFYATVWAYYQVEPSAGLILAPSAVWITFAATIVWGIWDLSARPPLYPTKGESRLALELQESR